MRSDREGLEDKRQCDMQPQTGVLFSLCLSHSALPYSIKTSAKKAPQMKTGEKAKKQ